jgi:hypothetical protein
MNATPVMFPPGRARLVTSPFSTGSALAPITTAIVVVARLAASARSVSECDQDVNPRLAQLDSERV